MASASSSSSAFVSSGSKSPATTGFYEAAQMGGDSCTSPMREAHSPADSALSLSPSSDGREPATDLAYLDSELISSTSRLSRLPNKVPSSPQPNTSSTNPVAISAYQNNLNTNTSQDVHHFVNSSTSLPTSTVNRSGLTSSPETSVSSSFTQPLQHHVLTHPIRRPRTSANIFQSSTDLATHYGIPQVLPPAPKITPRTTPPTVSKPPSSVTSDYNTLCANYLTMLNNTSTDPVTRPSATAMSMNAPFVGYDAPVVESDEPLGMDINDIISMTPDFQDIHDFSPMVPDLEYLGISPCSRDDSEFLVTPQHLDDLFFNNEPLLSSDDVIQVYADSDSNSLFPEHVDHFIPAQFLAPSPKVAAVVDPFAGLETISPNTPALDSFQSFAEPVAPAQPVHAAPVHTVHASLAPLVQSITPSAPSSTLASAPDTTTTSRRSKKATGIRKGITPENLLDENAPTQPRNYATPSATSRKEVPAVFARKRTRSVAFVDDEEDQLDTLPPNASERDLIEQKRRQNTVAARRSRKRKLEHYQMLERDVDIQTRLKEVWQERANVLAKICRDHGIPVPQWESDEEAIQGI